MRGLATLLLLLMLGCPQSDSSRPLTVFAAASTVPLLEAVARDFEAGSGIPVRISGGASSTLARQIDAGARFDLFVSAHPQWTDYLAGEGLTAGSSTALMTNQLVVVVPAGRAGDTTEQVLREAERVAIADPEHVPLGLYTQEALTAAGLWEALEPRLLPAADARATLRLVELQEADAGVVYASDALGSQAVLVVAPIRPELHAPIRYTMALSADPHRGTEALRDFLASEAVASRIREHGFLPVGKEAP